MAMEAVAVEMREMRMVSVPGYGRLFPSRSTKPAKEDSAAVGAFFDDIVVTKRPQAERKMAVAKLHRRTIFRMRWECGPRRGTQTILYLWGCMCAGSMSCPPLASLFWKPRSPLVLELSI